MPRQGRYPVAMSGELLETTAPEDEVSLEQERVTATLITVAQAQVAAALSNADTHDTKALALLAVDVGGVALLVTTRSSLDRFWWVAMIPALVSAAGFVWTLLPREFFIGPDVEAFYREFIGSPPLDANVAVLASLNQALKHVRDATDQKRAGWIVGALVMAGALPVCTAYLAVVH